MSLDDVSDVFVIVAGSIAVFALIVQVRALKQQQKLQDFSAFNTLSNELRELWQSFVLSEGDAQTAQRQFLFAELLNKYEAMCFMFNNNILGTKVEELLKQHIIEVLLMWLTEDETRTMISGLQSGQETFVEISKFIKRHRKSYQAHWDFLQESPLVQDFS
ncbi:MAG: hypothetical protein AB7O49_17440 [Sphingomonadales bacterium]